MLYSNLELSAQPGLANSSDEVDIQAIVKTSIKVAEYAKSCKLEVGFTIENSFRLNVVDLLEILSAVDRTGVQYVGIVDSVGSASPRQVYDFIQMVRKVINCDIKTSFSNSTQCAVANSYTALEAGAIVLNTSICKLDEHEGLTPLGGMLRKLQAANQDHVTNRYRLGRLKDVEDLVAHAIDDTSVR